jgi:hypothetical protein
VNGTRTALTDAATVLRAGQIESISQYPQQRHGRIVYLDRVNVLVDIKLYDGHIR